MTNPCATDPTIDPSVEQLAAIAAAAGPVELVVDHVAKLVTADGIAYYLTLCCDASVTGVEMTAANPHGVACRSCYQPIDVELAAAWDVRDEGAWADWSSAFLADMHTWHTENATNGMPEKVLKLVRERIVAIVSAR